MPTAIHGAAGRRGRLPPSRLWAAALLIGVAGCAGLAEREMGARVASFADAAPSPATFHYCYGYGCEQRLRLTLSAQAWREITHPLEAAPADAAAERQAIALAAVAFERKTGRLTGTDADLGGTFPGLGREGQLDCVDEAVNMTQFLRLLERDGLLRWHTIGATALRGNIVDAWPHVTATLRERATGRVFAIDSWFFDSGEAPVVIPLSDWRAGGDPLTACPATIDAAAPSSLGAPSAATLPCVL